MSPSTSHATASGARRRLIARRARSASGFTLVELAIALVAGLMVSMAVMGVSKEATNTFHEEVRVSGAEMALRIAMERIRLDLQRAAYMCTGNMQGDPQIAKLAGATNNLSNFNGSVPYSLLNLSGITLHPGGASALQDATVGPQLTANNLTPDVMDIGGNMSTSDEYAVAILPGPPVFGGCGGNYTISIQMDTPAGWRIRNAETAAAAGPGYVAGLALQAAFHPGPSLSSQFLIKVTDPSGRSQYVLGCPGGPGIATYYNPVGLNPTAYVNVSPSSTILNNIQTGGQGGVGGLGVGVTTANPVEVVRWDIMSPAELQTVAPTAYASYLYSQTAGALADQTNFLLTRSYLDFSTQCTNSAPCPIDPMTTEIVAEYAVDLKFGLTVDEFPACATGFPCPIAAPTYTSNPLVNLTMNTPVLPATPFASPPPTLYAGQSGAYLPNQGPQRVRDVQVRIGIRSQFGDRAVTLTPETTLTPGYMYRYQLAAPSLHFAPATQYARVRENTTEVTLPNQARFYW